MKKKQINNNWGDADCDIVNEELKDIYQIIVPTFPQFKKPTYKKRFHLELNTRSNVCSPAKFDDTVSISTKKSTNTSMVGGYNYIVNHFLTQLKDHINKETRQEIESSIIRNLISQKGKPVYMLEMNWAANYTAYLQNQHSNVPNAITNNKLYVEDCEVNSFKQELKQDVDYVLMNRNTWLFIQSVYGGGPEVLYTDYAGTESQSVSKNSSQQNIDICLNSPGSFQKHKFTTPAIGLYNEHNFCFMHAALQSLLSIEQINCWMITEGKTKQSKWIQAYNEILNQVLSCKKGQFVKISTMKTLIKDRFAPNLQHDCQEFLCYLTEQLNKELKQDKFDQPITEILFQGQMMSLINCLECTQQSSKFESFFELSLSMNKFKGLQSCLKQFFAQEKLSDNYYCEKCKKNAKAVKKYIIGTPPQFLVIHLKRFQEQKLHNYIEFQTSLNMSDYCSFKAQYKLISVVVHYGTQEKGHYVNFSLRQNQWYYFDDHRVQQVRESDVLKQQAYILFYEKIEEQI